MIERGMTFPSLSLRWPDSFMRVTLIVMAPFAAADGALLRGV